MCSPRLRIVVNAHGVHVVQRRRWWGMWQALRDPRTNEIQTFPALTDAQAVMYAEAAGMPGWRQVDHV